MKPALILGISGQDAAYRGHLLLEKRYRVAAGSNQTLQLGDLSIARDWGWAPEYVKAMWLML